MLQKTLKIFLWPAGIGIALAIFVPLAVQIPSVQQYIVHRVSLFIGNKTQGRVEIGRAGILFPASVFIDGLFVAGRLKDTLLYVGEVKANIDVFTLFSGNIRFRWFSLKNCKGIVSRTEDDSLFNYQFLVTALSPHELAKKPSPKTRFIHELFIDKINFENLHFKYDDHYDGMFAEASLEKLLLTNQKIMINYISPADSGKFRKMEKKSLFDGNALTIDGLNCRFTADKGMSAKAPKPKADFLVNMRTLKMSNCSIDFNDRRGPVKSSSLPGGKTGLSHSFDASHIHFNHINIAADSISLGPEHINAFIRKAAAQDSNWFNLANLSTDIKMNGQGISASNITVGTAVSKVTSSLELKYPSMAFLKDSLQNVTGSMNIKSASLGMKDVFYFIPNAAKSPVLNGPLTRITAAGTITGSINEFKGEKIFVKFGNNTSLKTDCTITGLPDVKNVRFNFSSMAVVTGRKDIENMMGDALALQTVSLPEHIEVSATGIGGPRKFESTVAVRTEYGNVSATGSLDTDGAFVCTINVNDFNAGMLLKKMGWFGPITAQASFSGNGLGKNTMHAAVKINAASLYFNKYAYHNIGVNGTITGLQFAGKISLDDPNAAVAFDGAISSERGKEHYDFSLDMKEVNLHKLNILEDDIRVSATADVHLKGKDLASISGLVGVTRIIMTRDGVDYKLDSLVYVSENTRGKSTCILRSDPVDLWYEGNVSTQGLAGEMKRFKEWYFPVQNKPDSSAIPKVSGHFTFDIRVRYHPLVTMFLPHLTGFSPGAISGRFDNENALMFLKADFPEINYSGIRIGDAKATANSDGHELDFRISARRITHGRIALGNTAIDGSLRQRKALVNLSSIDDNGFKKFIVPTHIEKHDGGYKITIAQDGLYLGNAKWIVAPDNFIDVDKNGIFVHDLSLNSPLGRISVNGFSVPKKSADKLDLRIDIDALPIKTIQALSMGSFTEGSGGLHGAFGIGGSTRKPVITGSVLFDDVFFNPSVLNNRLHLKNQKIEIKPTGIYFDHFTVLNRENQPAHIDGVVTIDKFPDIGFNLLVSADDFLVFNTTAKDNKMFYGKMIIDCRIRVKGSGNFPLVESDMKLDGGSYLTYAVPDRTATIDKGEGAVLFVDSAVSHPAAIGKKNEKDRKGRFKWFDVASDIEIDKKATLRLLIDPASNDSLVVRGSGKAHVGLKQGGKVNVTGLYTLTDGNYMVSFKSVIKRKFTIERGGAIIFNGDPLNADVDIRAVCAVSASPFDLVADQISGLSDTDKNGFRARLNFLVFLKLRGSLTKPDISFELQLPLEDKGALGGVVNAKLLLLNSDPSLLDKQVFALLTLGRFLQENPIASSNGNTISYVARSGVSSFLANQLNQLGAQVIPGVELNFDVQSFEDYSSGQATGRTQVGIGLSKQLFSERLIVQVGGIIDVEGAKAKQNTTNEIAGDVVVEYKMTDDGRFRLKGFRKNLNEDPLEGQLTETGAGISYTRNFNKWKNLFKSPRKMDKK
jgi:hypothetical protein